jgi:hypothetical protein
MSLRYLVITAALAATPTQASAQSLGMLVGNAGRVGGSPAGIDAALTGEVPIRAMRVRAELGFTGIDSTAGGTASVSITRTSIGVMRFMSREAARPFIGAGVGVYHYSVGGAADERQTSGYISGGFEIAGRRRAFTGELRLTSPLAGSSNAPAHAGVLFGLKRLF